MGIYLYKVSCTACSFEGMARYGPSASSYLLPDGELAPVRTAAAWCNGCHDVVVAEVLQSIASIEAEAEELRAPGAVREAFLVDAAGFAAGAEVILEMHLDSLRASARCRALRQSAARCLSCGSHDFVFLPGGANEPFAPLRHPSCEGTLQFASYAHAVPSRLLYSVEGERLEDP